MRDISILYQSEKKYQGAVIGCGRIGSMLEADLLRGHPCTHAGGFRMHPSVVLVAGCDTKKARRQAFSKLWNIPQVYSSFRQMLEEVPLDLVSIAVPTRLHSTILNGVLDMGIKGIILEKPVDLDLNRARRMMKKAASLNATILVNHTRRYNGCFRQAVQMVKEGEIGDIISITGYTLGGFWGNVDEVIKVAGRLGGGTLLHDGTHLADCIRMFMGDPTWAFASLVKRSKNSPVEDGAHGIFGFENGSVAFVEAGGPRDYFAFELDISGSKGRIRIGNGVLELYKTAISKRYEGFTELKKVPWDKGGEDMNFAVACVDDLVYSLENGTKPRSTGQDGLLALEMIFALYQSAKTKEVVKFPLKGVGISPLVKMIKEDTI